MALKALRTWLSWRCLTPSNQQRFYQSSTSNARAPERPPFPCLDAHAKHESLLESRSNHTTVGVNNVPERLEARTSRKSYLNFHSPEPLQLTYGSTLPSFDIAYETWGTLSEKRDNVILLHTGFSASSHAASTPLDSSEGWWEKFIGPGKALDTNRFFVICSNVLGGCFGTTGPSSIDPSTGSPYATHFPRISIFDMVLAQFRLLDHLGVDKLYASVGSSMGGMQSLAAGCLFPARVGKIVSISGTARSTPASIGMRFALRSVIMADPHWNNGFYYDHLPPRTGMKLARQFAAITHRSSPFWDLRFGRELKSLRASELRLSSDRIQEQLRMQDFGPDFLVETYLDYLGEQFCFTYDANSFIYLSKAVDLFDLTLPALQSLRSSPIHSSNIEHPLHRSHSNLHPPPRDPPSHLPELAAGLQALAHIPTLIFGVQSDILLPVEQQREVADALRMAGNRAVSYCELGGVWGHRTFLLDIPNIGAAIRDFFA